MKSIMQTSVIQILKLHVNRIDSRLSSHAKNFELYPQFVQINIDKLNILLQDCPESHNKILYKNIEQLYNLETLFIYFDKYECERYTYINSYH